MPLYAFKCTDCDLKFEKQKKVEERDYLERCPECGELAERVIEISNLIHVLKGDGWYKPKHELKE